MLNLLLGKGQRRYLTDILMLISKVDTQRYNDAFNSLSYNTHAAINN
jgi:hypothetical protein